MFSQILDYIKKLNPVLDKEQILEDIRITKSELDTIVIPSFKDGSDALKTIKLKSKANQELSLKFYENFDLQHGTKQATFINEIARRLPYLRENLDYIEEQIEEMLEDQVITSGVTAKKLMFIKAAECVSIISRMSSDVLTMVYNNETQELDGSQTELIELPPAIIKKVNSHIGFYAMLVSRYGIPNKDFSKVLSGVPDVVVNEKTFNSLKSVYSEKELDPISSGYLAQFKHSPIYAIRLMFAEWQTGRYNSAKDKKKSLELRLLNLQMTQDKKQDAKIQKEILYLQNRINKLEKYMAEVEEDLDLRG